MQAIQGSPQSDPLAQLKDIHVPSAVSAWPLDWGWWCLGTICLLSVIALIVMAIRKYKYNQPRREAKALLSALSPSVSNWPMEVNLVLKRTVLSYFPPSEVAGLYGTKWVSFLLNQVPDKRRTQIEKGFLQLNELHYAPDVDGTHFDECTTAAQHWLNSFKPATSPSKARNEVKQEASHA